MKLSSKRIAVIAGLAAAAVIGLSPVQAATVAVGDTVYPEIKSTTKSRAQVQTELADALRSGDIFAGGDRPVKLNEVYPGSYATKGAAVTGKTREQVKSESSQADIYAGALSV